MTTYRIEVAPNGFREYTETSSTDLLSLLGKLEAMKTASHNGGPVFLDDDLLEVVEVTNSPLVPEAPETVKTLLSWSRDDGEIYHADGIVGWHLVDENGINIHGETGDPFGLHSFEILVGDAAEQARASATSAGYRVLPVRAGEIENFTVVEKAGAAAPKP